MSLPSPPRMDVAAATAFLLAAALLTSCDSSASYAEMSDGELMTALAAVEFAALPADATCRVAGAWVEANPGDLPETLAEFSAGPVVARRAVFGAVSARTRYRLVRDHLAAVDEAGFSDEQRSKLSEIRRALHPGLFEESADRRAVGDAFTRAHGTSEELKTLFGAERAAAIFASVGGPTSNGDVTLNLREGEGGPGCTCSVYDPWCGDNTCMSGTCQNSTWGCGLLWRHDCDGGCNTDEAYPPGT